MPFPWILAALATGLIGSLHCVGMCGPLAMALPVGRLPRSQRGLGVGLYHLSRLTAYAGLGAVVGGVGQGLVLLGMQQLLSAGAGLLIVLWTLLLRGRWGGLRTTPARWLVAPLSRFLHRPSCSAFAAMGFLNGLLPCGFVYVALAGAVVTGRSDFSAVYMLLFGLGTLPALLTVRLLPALFPGRFRQRWTRLLPVFALGLGMLLLVRGLYRPVAVDNNHPIPLCHGPIVGSK